MTHTPYLILNAELTNHGTTLAKSCARWITVPAQPARTFSRHWLQTPPPGLQVPARAGHANVLWSSDAPNTATPVKTPSRRRRPQPQATRGLARPARLSRNAVQARSCGRAVARLCA